MERRKNWKDAKLSYPMTSIWKLGYLLLTPSLNFVKVGLLPLSLHCLVYLISRPLKVNVP